tara:strand:+ start:198 stop:530 length:333 start_codon:yes stop_codon:yes gene_type:complete
VDEPGFEEGNFEAWPLHDAVAGSLCVDWVERTCVLDLSVFFDPSQRARPAVVIWRSVRSVSLSRENPWGPSASVNDQRIETDQTFVIEMQSGDEIRVVAESAQLLESSAA